MSDRKLIGRVSATEKYPSSCDDFQFWLADDAILSPFDIVRVENKTDDSVTYGTCSDRLSQYDWLPTFLQNRCWYRFRFLQSLGDGREKRPAQWGFSYPGLSVFLLQAHKSRQGTAAICPLSLPTLSVRVALLRLHIWRVFWFPFSAGDKSKTAYRCRTPLP